jgi:hypothetical protein
MDSTQTMESLAGLEPIKIQSEARLVIQRPKASDRPLQVKGNIRKNPCPVAY